MIALAGAGVIAVGLAAAVSGSGDDGSARAGAADPKQAAVQAEKRLAELDRERKAQETALAELERRKNARESEIAETEERVAGLEKRREALKAEIAEIVGPLSPSGAPEIVDDRPPEGSEPVAAAVPVPQAAPAAPVPTSRPAAAVPLPPVAPAPVGAEQPEAGEGETPVRTAAVDQEEEPATGSTPPEAQADLPAATSTSAGPVRVFIHVKASDPLARERAMALAEELRRRGVAVAQIRGVPYAVRRDSLRFFHDADRASLSTLEQALRQAPARGAAPPVEQDYRSYSAPPRQGTLEIWLS